MSEKLVSGGILFAITSLATYSYHQIMSEKKERKRPYRLDIQQMEPIQEYSPILKNVTPNNTPASELIIPDQTLELFNEDNTLLTKEEDIEKIKKRVEQIEKTLDKTFDKTNSITMSSFFELYHTGSQTDTEELEFTKLENINKQRQIYGSPNIYPFNKGYSSEKDYKYDLSEEIDNKSYYSDSELYKKKRKIVNFLRK